METFIIIAILFWCILSVILFFKVWIMTNDVRRIANHLAAKTPRNITGEGAAVQNQRMDEVTGAGQQEEKDTTNSTLPIIVSLLILFFIGFLFAIILEQ